MADSGNNNITENSPNNGNDNNTGSICANDCNIGASTTCGASTACGANTTCGVTTTCGASTSVDVGGVSDNAVEEVGNDDSSSDDDLNLDLSAGTSGGGSDDDSCGICLGKKRLPVRVRCGHTFCRICLALHQSYDQYPWSNRCPNCRGTLEETPARITDDDFYYEDSDDENNAAMYNENLDDDEADDFTFEGLDSTEADEYITEVGEDAIEESGDYYDVTDSLTLVMLIAAIAADADGIDLHDGYVSFEVTEYDEENEEESNSSDEDDIEIASDTDTEDSDALSIQSHQNSFEVTEYDEENEEESNSSDEDDIEIGAFVLIPRIGAASSEEIDDLLNEELVPDEIIEDANDSDTENLEALSIQSHLNSFEVTEYDEENEEESNRSDEDDIEIGAFVLIPRAGAASSEDIDNFLNEELVPDDIIEDANDSDTEDSDALSIQSHQNSFEVNEYDEENEEESNSSDDDDIEIGAFVLIPQAGAASSEDIDNFLNEELVPDDIIEDANDSDTEDLDALSIQSHQNSFEINEYDEENGEESNSSDEDDIEIGAFVLIPRAGAASSEDIDNFLNEELVPDDIIEDANDSDTEDLDALSIQSHHNSFEVNEYDEENEEESNSSDEDDIEIGAFVLIPRVGAAYSEEIDNLLNEELVPDEIIEDAKDSDTEDSDALSIQSHQNSFEVTEYDEENEEESNSSDEDDIEIGAFVLIPRAGAASSEDIDNFLNEELVPDDIIEDANDSDTEDLDALSIQSHQNSFEVNEYDEENEEESNSSDDDDIEIGAFVLIPQAGAASSEDIDNFLNEELVPDDIIEDANDSDTEDLDALSIQSHHNSFEVNEYDEENEEESNSSDEDDIEIGAFVLIPRIGAASSEEIDDLLNEELVPDDIIEDANDSDTEDLDALSIQSHLNSFEVTEYDEENEEESNSSDDDDIEIGAFVLIPRVGAAYSEEIDLLNEELVPDEIIEDANDSDTEDLDALSIQSHQNSFEVNEYDEENEEESNSSDEDDIKIGAFESLHRKMCTDNKQANSDETTNSSTQSLRDENTANEGENHTEQNDAPNDNLLLPFDNEIIPPEEEENHVADVVANDTVVTSIFTLLDDVMEQLIGLGDILS